MLERMDAFFDARLGDYDAHMLRDIEGAGKFYPFTAQCLPMEENTAVLDLGCGTGLELEYYFALNPTASVTGIDLAPGMLRALNAKFPRRDLRLILGSYFDTDLGCGVYDAAVSVESLHHFTQQEKTALYTRLHAALKSRGYFILTDYFALDDENERHWRQELARLKQENGITDDSYYHYDTPLTVAHETQALLDAGFRSVKVLGTWGATSTLRADV